MNGRTNTAVGGVQLPELSNPAGAANIQSGYQAINGEGEVVTGTASVSARAGIQFMNTSSHEIMFVYGSVSDTGNISRRAYTAVVASGAIENFGSYAGSLIAAYVQAPDSGELRISGSSVMPIVTYGKYVIASISGGGIVQISDN